MSSSQGVLRCGHLGRCRETMASLAWTEPLKIWKEMLSVCLHKHQISSNIIKYHQISSNIIKYHQISSNIIKHNEVISRHFRILTYSDIGYDRLGWAVAQRLLLPAKDLDSRAWHRQFAIENGRRNSWFMLIYPLKLGWFSTMMLVYQRVIVDEYWMNIDWWIL